jgi:hypothetical protein
MASYVFFVTIVCKNSSYVVVLVLLLFDFFNSAFILVQIFQIKEF